MNRQILSIILICSLCFSACRKEFSHTSEFNKVESESTNIHDLMQIPELGLLLKSVENVESVKSFSNKSSELLILKMKSGFLAFEDSKVVVSSHNGEHSIIVLSYEYNISSYKYRDFKTYTGKIRIYDVNIDEIFSFHYFKGQRVKKIKEGTNPYEAWGYWVEPEPGYTDWCIVLPDLCNYWGDGDEVQAREVFKEMEDPGGGGTGGISEESLKYAIQNKPFAFFKDIPCEVIKAWVKTAKHTVPQPLIDRLNTIIWKSATVSPGTGAPGFRDTHVASVQKINNAYSTVVNMDYFPVTIKQLPVINGVRQNPYQFLEYIRTHINDFVDTEYGAFSPFKWSDINDHALWYSNDPLGSIVSIDIKGPDNGSVIVSGYSSDKWTFTTIYEPVYGKHPVSGNRDFGFTYNADGSYTFYTRGVDRLTTWDGSFFQDYLGGIPFKSADNLWKSFQNKVTSFVNEKQGISSISQEQIHRPDYEKLKAVLEGRAPLNSLRKDCPE